MKDVTVKLLAILSILSAAKCQKEAAENFLKWYNAESNNLMYEKNSLQFKRATNITVHNTKLAQKAALKAAILFNEIYKNASSYKLDDVDEDTKRQYDLMLKTVVSKREDVFKNTSDILTNMETIYSVGKIYYDKSVIKSINESGNATMLDLGDLSNIMKVSTDSEELLYVWKAWRDAVGRKLKGLYTDYIQLRNIGAREHGYKDVGDYRRKMYEVNNLPGIAEEFWNELKPFYQEIHAYVRYRLKDLYGDAVTDGEPIPAHLLGDMWGQDWSAMYKHFVPYKDEPNLDVTPVLKKNYGVKQMFQTAEEFFVSLGWPKLPEIFWKKSLFVKPSDREVVCHASAWNLGVETKDGPDVRMKMCTEIDQDNFNIIHHELGHIYYFLLYWDQPTEYQAGANPGFHEAVGETIVLSVQTPDHLRKIGLITNASGSYEADINFLFMTALKRVVFLPFGYLVDQWMWGVYSDDIKPEEYNKKWWELRLKYQGLKPPLPRNETDFDPGAKYHIPADRAYIRYFFAHILQFAFHKHACKHANITGPVHKCSIYQSKAAGKAFGDMLKLGKKKPWPEALKQFTGSEKVSTGPIIEYFQPLIDWLKKKRKEKKYKLGWENDKTNSHSKVFPSIVLTFATLLLTRDIFSKF